MKFTQKNCQHSDNLLTSEIIFSKHILIFLLNSDMGRDRSRDRGRKSHKKKSSRHRSPSTSSSSSSSEDFMIKCIVLYAYIRKIKTCYENFLSDCWNRPFRVKNFGEERHFSDLSNRKRRINLIANLPKYFKKIVLLEISFSLVFNNKSLLLLQVTY